MKKTLYQLGMFAAIALAFTACNKEADSTQNDGGKHAVTVTIGKQVDTKTAFGDTEGTYVWSDGDAAYLHVYENNAEGEITDFSLSGDNKVATLTVTFANASGPYTYTAKFAKEMSGSKNPYVQPTQSPTATSFDPTADVLISKETEDLTNLETRPASLTFTMGRVVTVNKLTLTNLEEGEIIDKVEISLDQTLYGYVSPDSNGGYKCTNGGKKLTIIYNNDTASSGLVPDDGSFPVYFVSAPVSAAGIESVVVTTDKNVYTKAGNTEATDPFYQKTITFAIGNMTRFAMDMDGFGEAIPDDVDYTLVSDEDMIADGGEYIIVSTKNKDGDLCAASAYGSGNSYFYTATDVTANDNVITIAAEPVMVFTLEAGSTAGQFYIKDGDGKYIFWETSGNNVKRGAKGTTNAYLWTVEPDAITNVGTDTRLLQYNASSPRFACYTGSQTAISLYVNASTITQLANPELSFSTSEVEVVWEVDHWGDFSQPVLNNPHNLPITWTSSDPDVASFEDDVLTLNGNGTTTITASSEKTDTYSAGSASYTLTLSGAPVKGSAELPFTVAEAIEAINEASGGSLTDKYAKGIICSVSNNYNSTDHYVTFNMSEDGLSSGSILQAYHATANSENEFKVGDYVVLKGTLKKYNSTYEFDAGAIKVAQVRAPSFTPNGGSFSDESVSVSITADEGATIYYTTNGTIPSILSSTYSEPILITETTTIKAFATKDDISTGVITAVYTINPNANDGSLEHPYTASEARTLALNGNTGTYYIRGYISKVQNQFSASYGTANMWLSDNNDDVQTFEGYKIKFFNNTNWVEGNGEIAVGDEVIINGTLTLYNTTPETSSGYLVSLNGKTKGLTPGSLTATPDDANKQITVFWGAATGTDSVISYEITCGDQSFNANAEGSHTFTMSDYGIFNITLVATALDAISATATINATLSDTNSTTKDYYKLVTNIEDITAGTYVVGALRSTSANNNFYFGKATVSSGDWVVSDNYVTVAESNGIRKFEISDLPSGAVEFTLTGDNTNGFTICNGANYLYYTTHSNRKLAFANNNTASSCKWKAEKETTPLINGGIHLSHVGSEAYTISENSTATGAIRGYANTTSYRAIYLFKKVTE